ncbi:MAG: hypothetical protein AAF378_10040 [Cyanobacteria bacterium P01_A01_bin.84]
MNLRVISAGLLLSTSLTTGALPAAALSSQYDLSNLHQNTQALNVSDDGGVFVAQRVKNRQRRRQVRKVCTNKRIRVKGRAGRRVRIRVVRKCRLVRVGRINR